MRKPASYIISSLFFCFGFYFYAKSATYYSILLGGNWGNAATWSTSFCSNTVAGTVPTVIHGTEDDGIILSGHLAIINGNHRNC